MTPAAAGGTPWRTNWYVAIPGICGTRENVACFKSESVAAKLWASARAAARKVTLEPAIILVAIMSGVGNGVKVQTNLQLWKVRSGLAQPPG